ncbi:N-acetylglucosaminyl-diphospho-decaprenol L-rhamnosyltransferase [Aquisphaera giovannonii]|uniref:N-acetylglucosaminyl-diphospho-decaprenol L-rhamnosyltransferase n=1 Tax=Aquisphaera giovannonii TaxID=406548 RepID=A0A5B9WCS8_9BACT|nr:glycosyltransferase family 2 protein [Aquisphaera giovannonii]QEH37865.1 N-acetylglucosaminyl-diphospho-decaprenol L-rhamnosyltransferase [Aquisphaera giovannonii]
MKATNLGDHLPPGAPVPTLAVVLVNYNSWPDVDRVVGGLVDEPEFRAGRFQVVVVDNASRGPIPDRFTSLPQGVRLLSRPDNGGFAAGVNAGWRVARGRWLLILNPDVEVERGWIGQVLGRIAEYDRRPEGPPGIVGFGLRNPDGSTQGSVGVFPSLGRTIREQFIPRSRRKYQAGWRIRPGRVDWVTGACMLVHSGMMSAVGGMDEDFFLYHEEVALSRSAQDLGWPVEYDPGLGVVHRHPLQDRAVSPKMRVILRHSKLLYFWKHLPGRPFRAILGIVAAEAAIRGAAAAMLGRTPEARAWRTIRSIVGGFRRGNPVRGRDVLRLAEDAESGDVPADGGIPGREMTGRHEAGPEWRKDGSACRATTISSASASSWRRPPSC